MVSTTALISIGTIVFSFISGLLFYYLIVNETKEIRKQRIDSVLSVTINFVLFIWASKIVLHINTFMKDPVAVLAYPSDSTSVYLATILIGITIIYQVIYKKSDGVNLFNTFVPILISTLFIYEFLRWIIQGENQAMIQLTFSMILLILYFILQNKMKVVHVSISVFLLWTFMNIGMAVYNNYSIVFEYSLSAYYFLSLLILVLFYIVYSNRRSNTKK